MMRDLLRRIDWSKCLIETGLFLLQLFIAVITVVAVVVGSVFYGLAIGARAAADFCKEHCIKLMDTAKIPSHARVTAIILIVVAAILIGWQIKPVFHLWIPFKSAVTPLPKFVLGKGMWIYQVNKAEDGDVDRMVKRAKGAGLDYILVKTHDGSDWVRYNPKAKIQAIVDKFHEGDIKVIAWGYVYGNYPENEAARAIEALSMGCDGYVFNAEVHMRHKRNAAEIQCSLVRDWVDSNAPERVLGYSTFCRVQNQGGIPFEVYDRYCDVAMPQVYFSWFSGWSPRDAAFKTMNIWLAEQSSWSHRPKPIIPTLESSSGAADMPATSARDLKAAAQGFRRYYGVNFYAWDVSTDKLWAEIKAAPGCLDYQRRNNGAKALQDAELLSE